MFYILLQDYYNSYARHRLKQVNKTNMYNQYESWVPRVLWLAPAPPFGTQRLTH